MMRQSAVVTLGVALLTACARGPKLSGYSAANPAVRIEELVAADRAFAASAAGKNSLSALSPMFGEEIWMVTPSGLVNGKQAVIEVLRSQNKSDDSTSTVTWTPTRAGISSDGMHGFTHGFMTTTRRNGQKVEGKYMGYWIRQTAGWRLAAYKRMRRPDGEVSLAMTPPSMPVRGLVPGDSATVLRYANELRAAESAFSDDGARLGLGPAFEKWGAKDATNAGGTPDWVVGPEAIAQQVSPAGSPSGPGITWSSTEAIVSRTGDLGVSIGYIKRNGATDKGRPFFTIWKRATPSSPWRYVDE